MNVKLKRWTTIALAFAMLCALSACNRSGKEADTTPLATLKPEFEEAFEEDLTQPGGELRIFVPKDAVSIDPLLAQSKEVRAALSLTFEPLIRYDGQLMLAPSLAESWEPLDPMGSRWKISLRRGVKWHGTQDEFSSDDVIFTLGLLESPDYATSVYFGDLKRIKSYQKIDQYTLEVTANTPGSMVMNSFVFPIVSQEHYRRGSAPIGTGPYKLVYASKSNGIKFSANEQWWRTPPNIKSVIAKCMQNTEEALGSFKTDQLNYVPTIALTTSRYRESGKVGIIELQTQFSEALLLNHRNPILQDLRVRKAIAFALDRRDIVSKAYLNHAYVTDVPIPPNSWLFHKNASVYDFNVETSKTLLSEAGWDDMDSDGILDNKSGLEIRSLALSLIVNDTPDSQVRKDVANLIKAQLEKVGISVNVIYSPWTSNDPEYINALKEGRFDMALAGFNLDQCPDLSDFLMSTGEKNYGAYVNYDMDSMLKQAQYAVDSKALHNALNVIQQKFIEDVPFIHLYFRTSSVVCSDDIVFSGFGDVRDNSPYYGIEKWYINNRGRKNYTATTISGELNWGQFLEEPVAETPDVSASPSASPEKTQYQGGDNQEDRETAPPDTPRPTRKPTEATPRPKTQAPSSQTPYVVTPPETEAPSKPDPADVDVYSDNENTLPPTNDRKTQKPENKTPEKTAKKTPPPKTPSEQPPNDDNVEVQEEE